MSHPPVSNDAIYDSLNKHVVHCTDRNSLKLIETFEITWLHQAFHSKREKSLRNKRRAATWPPRQSQTFVHKSNRQKGNVLVGDLNASTALHGTTCHVATFKENWRINFKWIKRIPRLHTALTCVTVEAQSSHVSSSRYWHFGQEFVSLWLSATTENQPPDRTQSVAGRSTLPPGSASNSHPKYATCVFYMFNIFSNFYQNNISRYFPSKFVLIVHQIQVINRTIFVQIFQNKCSNHQLPDQSTRVNYTDLLRHF